MARNALLESPRDGQMFVPPEKVAEYLVAGWKMIQPADAPLSMNPMPVAVETEPAAAEAPVSAESKPVRRKSPKNS
jgi:hypothetical protein